MKGKHNISLFLSVLFMLYSCHKSTNEPSSPCSGQQTELWPRHTPATQRFNLSDSLYYNMQYHKVDSICTITFSKSFINSCAKPKMQMTILIQGNWTTIQGKVYMSYCPGTAAEEIDVPAVWTGHWYDRKASVQKNMKDCSSFPDSQITIWVVYSFPSTGSRSTDLNYMSYASEYLSFTATFGD